MQITVPDLQQAVAELARQYEKDGETYTPHVLETALTHWLTACVERIAEEPLYYALGRPFGSEWEEALEKARRPDLAAKG